MSTTLAHETPDTKSRLLSLKLRKALTELRLAKRNVEIYREVDTQFAGRMDAVDPSLRCNRLEAALVSAKDVISKVFGNLAGALSELSEVSDLSEDYGVPDLGRTLVLWFERESDWATVQDAMMTASVKSMGGSHEDDFVHICEFYNAGHAPEAVITTIPATRPDDLDTAEQDAA